MSKFSHDAAADDDARAMTIPPTFSSKTAELKIDHIEAGGKTVTVIIASCDNKPINLERLPKREIKYDMPVFFVFFFVFFFFCLFFQSPTLNKNNNCW